MSKRLSSTKFPVPIPVTPDAYGEDHDSESDSMDEEFIEDLLEDNGGPTDDDLLAPCLELILETVFKMAGAGYVFEELLSWHGPSAVFSADKEGEKVAVKIKVKQKELSDPIEVRVLSKLDHCGVQRFISYHRFDETYALTTRLEKEDSIRKCVFGNLDKIREFMRQLLEIVAYLHSKRIIYRDLKLSNLLWNDAKNQLILVDFDLSTFEGKKEHTRYAGTEGFESPEVRREQAYDRKVDIWGCGVVFWCLLTSTSECDCEVDKITRWLKKKRHKPHHLALVKMLSHRSKERPAANALLKLDFFQNAPETNQTAPVHFSKC